MPRPKNPTEKDKLPKRVTLQDIAKIAGVHVMTVSDALKGTRAAPATQERVRQIAQELNYIPNFAARALATGRTGIIALWCGATNEPYYGNMVHLLQSHINADGYKTMLLRSPGEAQQLFRAAGDTAVDGAIAIDRYHPLDSFHAHPNVPLVSISAVPRKSVDHVVVDLSEGIEDAIFLMLIAGRQRVAYLVPSLELTLPSEPRAATYLMAMHNAEHAAEIINVGTIELPHFKARFKAYIEANGCPDALLCQNDDLAMRAFRVLRDMGYSVPDDVLLVGCDGQPNMEFFDPPLSTIAQPMEEIAETSWRFLQGRMAQPNAPIQSARLQGNLVVRQSLLSHSAVVVRF